MISSEILSCSSSIQCCKLPKVVVGDLEIADMSKAGQGEVKNVKANIGLSFPNTAIIFEKAEGTSINLIGKSKGKVSPSFSFTRSMV